MSYNIYNIERGIQEMIPKIFAQVRGFKFLVTNRTDYIQEHWLNHKFYEEKMLDYIKENYKGGNFVDVGSNVGNHAIYFSGIADTVYSFEPVLQSFNAQMDNIKLNKIKNIEIFQCALGNENKMVGLMHNISNMGNTKVIEEDYGDRADEFVLMYKLDDFKLKNVKVIKVDVEGYELKVLEGAKQTLQENNAAVFVECLSPANLKETSTYLDNLGYNIWKGLTFDYVCIQDRRPYQDRVYIFTKGERRIT